MINIFSRGLRYHEAVQYRRSSPNNCPLCFLALGSSASTDTAGPSQLSMFVFHECHKSVHINILLAERLEMRWRPRAQPTYKPYKQPPPLLPSESTGMTIHSCVETFFFSSQVRCIIVYIYTYMYYIYVYIYT